MKRVGSVGSEQYRIVLPSVITGSLAVTRRSRSLPSARPVRPKIPCLPFVPARFSFLPAARRSSEVRPGGERTPRGPEDIGIGDRPAKVKIVDARWI